MDPDVRWSEGGLDVDETERLDKFEVPEVVVVLEDDDEDEDSVLSKWFSI
jgi:hypothetical protein